jgi:hypothetical protein
MKNSTKIVLLIGNSWMNKKTAFMFLESGMNVEGVVICNQKKWGVNLNYLKIAYKKYGVLKLAGQILERIYYKIANRSKDRIIFNRLVNRKDVSNCIKKNEHKIHYTNSYESKESLDF